MLPEGGKNFGSEMNAISQSFKTKFGNDPMFIFTQPSKKLVSDISPAKGIKGKYKTFEIKKWEENVNLEALLKFAKSF
jgi:hypothetical protein